MTDLIPARTPAHREDPLSKYPALDVLTKLGWRYLAPGEALRMRRGKTSEVLLFEVLERALRRINVVRFRGETQPFTDGGIAEAVRRLRETRDELGLVTMNQHVWDLVRLPTSIEQTIEGTARGFPLRYVDWDDPAANEFHVTEEFAVDRPGGSVPPTYRPDLVLFVNGIPFAVIECKQPGLEKDPLALSIRQHLRNQATDGIQRLYAYAQVLFGLAVTEARYGAVGTREKFWMHWRDAQGDEHALADLVSRPLLPDVAAGIPLDCMDAMEEARSDGGRSPTAQDRLLASLARPQRLLEMASRFTVFDAGERKLARYQQYECVRRCMERLQTRDAAGVRAGGVVWHTQGSGKTLTMVMLAEAIRRDRSIRNPKIVLVTDRVDLDEAVHKTFTNCELEVVQASTGKHLQQLLADPKARIVTTLVNKFEAAVKDRGARVESDEVFVLVDEGHRTQFGTLHAHMRRTMPRASYFGFTGTPLFKKDKSTQDKFGGIVHSYRLQDAVADGAVVPILYEGRMVQQSVDCNRIDEWLERTTRGLSKEQVADLKRRFSNATNLSRTEKTIRLIAWDVANHFERNVRGTGLKAQLATPRKEDALLYKRYLDEFGIACEVVISPPDDREGEDAEPGTIGVRPDVVAWWKEQMQRYGSEKDYQRSIVSRFQGPDAPEILIVVDKLLTGFDAPRNTYLYLARKLKEHTLLQAIARVNRLREGKDYGHVIDYVGVLPQLGEALGRWGELADGFDAEDLEGSVIDVGEVLARLPTLHAEVWKTLESVRNKQDFEAVLQAFEPQDLRTRFYARLTEFARVLQTALSTVRFHDEVPTTRAQRYRDDLKYFLKVRQAAQRRYAETVDFREYLPRIQKLLDDHVGADGIEVVVKPVDIFDSDAFQKELDEIDTDRSKAHVIANRVRRSITEHMEEDPALFRRFSEMLEEAIRAYKQERLTDAQYLARVREVLEGVRNRSAADVPAVLRDREVARAYFGILETFVASSGGQRDLAAKAACACDDAIESLRIVDWTRNVDQQNRMRQALEDGLLDLLQHHGFKPSFGDLDRVLEEVLAVARARRP